LSLAWVFAIPWYFSLSNIAKSSLNSTFLVLLSGSAV